MLAIFLTIIFISLISLLIYIFFTKLIPAKQLMLKHIIGKQAKTMTPLGPTPFDTGKIKVKGDIFPAITMSHDYIPKGTTVIIKSYQGIRIIVEKLE